MPPIRAQKDLRRFADVGDLAACFADTGGFKFMPCALAEARPLALSPPLGFLPALRCQAAVLATVFWALHQLAVRHAMKSLWHFLRGLFLFCVCHYSMLLKPWLVLALIAGA